jgi:hypothetical protein
LPRAATKGYKNILYYAGYYIFASQYTDTPIINRYPSVNVIHCPH